MRLSKTQTGELYLYSEALLWSLFPIVTIFSYNSISPLYSAAFSTFAAALFFAVVLTAQKRWKELFVTAAWKYILALTAIIGIAFYSLVFIGIQKTTAGNAGIIFLMEIFFSMVILRLWKKEFLSRYHLIGAVLMALGAFLVLFHGSLNINQGDLIILIATALPPIGNYFIQEARKKVSSTYIMFIRSLISGFFMLGMAYFIETEPSVADIRTSLLFIAVNGFLLLGLSKIFWIEAIHRIPITKAISLASIAPFFTLFFAYLFLSEIPTPWQISGLIPIMLGTWILTDFKTARKAMP